MEEQIESILKRNFQKNIEIEIDNKIIKRGRFILYKMTTITNYFHIELYIERASNIEKHDTFKLPYPFAIEEYEDEGLIYLDYRLKTLFKNESTKKKFEEIYNSSKNKEDILKFYDKIVVIKFT